MSLVYNYVIKKSMLYAYLIQRMEKCNMKRVNQIHESKMLIKDALFRLLEKKEFEEITLTEIAKEAGVVRMTLYRHFKEKEDILIFSFEQLFNQAMEKLNKTSNENLLELLTFRLDMLKNSKEAAILVNNDQIYKLFNSFRLEQKKHFDNFIPISDDIYTLPFISGGIESMTRQWYENGMIEPTIEIARKMNNFIIKCLS